MPLRAISEELSADVGWDNNTKTATVDYDLSNSDMSQMIANVSPSVVAIVGNYIYESSGSTGKSTAYGNGVVIKGNGPLVNANGELVGINSSKFVSPDIEGIAFTIPTETVRYAINQFENYGKIRQIDAKITNEESWAATIDLPTA